MAGAASEYAAVTERVALGGTLGIARLGGSGAPEKAYTLATEAFREELEKVSSTGGVVTPWEKRLDESGRVRRLKTRTEIVSVGYRLGGGDAETDLAVEPAEGLQLLIGAEARAGRSRAG